MGSRLRDALEVVRDRAIALLGGVRQPAPVPASTQMFEIAFDRPPTPREQELMDALDRGDGATRAQYLRRALAVTEQMDHPTPVSVRFGPGEIEYLSAGDFEVCIDRADYAVALHLKNTGSYEPHLSGFLRRNARPGMCAIDIGANIGVHTMLLAHAVGPQGVVHAVEPRSENCRLLLLAAARNGFANIRLHPVAASDRTGFLALVPSIGSNASTKTVQDLTDPATMIVPAAALDDLVAGPVDIIKADIEGAEYLALRGAETILRRDRPVITSELSFVMAKRASAVEGPDFVRWLMSFGYRAFILQRNDGRLAEITDLASFAAEWGDPYRIEDLAFLPREHPLALEP